MTNEKCLPDFAIVGAPKCGTSSLFAALSRHPQVCMSLDKEPHYFATDLPGKREISDFEGYRGLFRPTSPRQLLGEGSTFYLYSTQAIATILHRNPSAKFIAIVRNPIDLFVSLHNELVKTLTEDQNDLEKAWRLQATRRSGRAVPACCPEQRLLFYRDVCSLGAQIGRLFSVVPPRQRLVLFFHELVHAPLSFLAKVHTFLGLPAGHGSSPGSTMGHENPFMAPRTQLIPRLVHSSFRSPVLNALRRHSKPLANALGLRPLAWLMEANLRRARRPVLHSIFREELVEVFREDVGQLGELLKTELHEWLTGPATRRGNARPGGPEAVPNRPAWTQGWAE